MAVSCVYSPGGVLAHDSPAATVAFTACLPSLLPFSSPPPTFKFLYLHIPLLFFFVLVNPTFFLLQQPASPAFPSYLPSSSSSPSTSLSWSSITYASLFLTPSVLFISTSYSCFFFILITHALYSFPLFQHTIPLSPPPHPIYFYHSLPSFPSYSLPLSPPLQHIYTVSPTTNSITSLLLLPPTFLFSAFSLHFLLPLLKHSTSFSLTSYTRSFDVLLL